MIHLAFTLLTTTGAGGVVPQGDLYLKRTGFGQSALSGSSYGPDTLDFSFGAMFPTAPSGLHLVSTSFGFYQSSVTGCKF